VNRRPARAAAAAAAAATVAAAAVLGGLGSLGGVVQPAGAQTELGCPPEVSIEARIDEAPTAFTGTVRALGNNKRTATVDVIRVWKGGPLPHRVQVTGTLATQAKVVTALDRPYASNRTYLFLPTAGSSPRFAENRCSATRTLDARLSAQLAAKVPDGGTAPVGEGVPLPSRGLGKLVPLMVAVPALLVLAGLLLAARRKSKRDRRPTPAPA
jgi:hypothetical protein